MVGVGVLLIAILAILPVQTPAAPPEIDAQELSAYRLRGAVFERFQRATRLIVAATRNDVRFQQSPLFSREVTLSGEAVEMAIALQRRLEQEPVLAGALFAADLDPREYAKFALTLFAARLAHGFLESGVLRRVPPGTAAENVAFVEAHEDAIAALLRDIGLE